MYTDEFEELSMKNIAELGVNNDDLFSLIDFLRASESFNKPSKRQQIINLYNHGIEFNEIEWFYNFYTSCNSDDITGIKESLDQLTVFAQMKIFEEFKEFFDYQIPKLLVDLFLTDDIELHNKIILFMTELGKSQKQKLFEPIINCTFFENIIHSASINFSDETYITNVLEFFQNSYENFKCTRTEILRIETLNFFKNTILNHSFTIETRIIPIKILSGLSQFPNLDSIQKSQIFDFLAFFFENPRSELFWKDILTIIKLMIMEINDESFYQLIMNKIQYTCLKLMMNNKNVAIVTNSILILNLHFNHYSSPIEIISDDSHFNRLIKLSKSSNNSLSRAALKIINNIMESDSFLFNSFLSNDIIPIVISKIEEDYQLKTKYAAAEIMANIIKNGTTDQQILCAQSGFIHYFLEIISIDIEKFIITAIPPLMTLLELGTTDPQFSFIWNLFDEEDGFQIIYELKDSIYESDTQNIDIRLVIDDIIEMRNSLDE